MTDAEKLTADLAIVRAGLAGGDFGDRCGMRHPLPGWALILGDAIKWIEEHDEIMKLRRQVAALKKERKGLHDRNSELSRITYVLQRERDS